MPCLQRAIGTFSEKIIFNKGFIKMSYNFTVLSGKTIRSFNASAEINDIINESGIKKGELSNWINDKIAKGLLYTGTKPEALEPERKIVSEVRLRY